MNDRKKIVFLTGTRADFGKLKSLMLKVQGNKYLDLHVFITGMHMLSKYGYTCEEVERSGFINSYKYINQNSEDGMDHVLYKTISGLSDYVREIKPDFLVVHGDRVEALAGATVGALNNILTGHIEGGEVSGTIDELIRHAVTKMSHVHFVANNKAKTRLIQLGECTSSIHVIGSPDIDVMNSKSLPSLDSVLQHYSIGFERYSILALHPVTTDISNLQIQTQLLLNVLKHSERNYVIIYPNNDHGSNIILNEFLKITDNSKFKIFPSMRFEYFLTLLKNADFIIGNSSAGVREAPHFGVPAINLGSRQHNRTTSPLVLNCEFIKEDIILAINKVMKLNRNPESLFGTGDAADKFIKIISENSFWKKSKQKNFIDLASI